MNTPRSLYEGRIVARRGCFLRKERQDPAFVSRLIFSPWNDLDDPAGAQGSRTILPAPVSSSIAPWQARIMAGP